MRALMVLALLAAVGCASRAPSADTPVAATPPATPVVALADMLAQSPASDWRALDPNNTLYMDLPTGRVVIELSPDFSPEHVENVRALARAHYWDGAAVLREQDNYVVQWGRPEGDTHDRGQARAEIATAEYDRPVANLPFMRLEDPDTYAAQTGFTNGFPAARDGNGLTWMIHCYGSIGVARDVPPSNGDGSELYAVNGQAPRNLDRNLAMVGRVVQGMELLSSLKRGTEALGFYATAPERTPIMTVRLASETPVAQRTNLEVLRTESATFAQVVASRRTRREAFFVQPTGRINVCNVNIPVRPIAAH